MRITVTGRAAVITPAQTKVIANLARNQMIGPSGEYLQKTLELIDQSNPDRPTARTTIAGPTKQATAVSRVFGALPSVLQSCYLPDP